jgi:hypothetical protein
MDAAESYFDFIAYDTIEMFDPGEKDFYKDVPKLTEFIICVENVPSQLAVYAGGAKMAQMRMFEPEYIRCLKFENRQENVAKMFKDNKDMIDQIFKLEPPPAILAGFNVKNEKKAEKEHKNKHHKMLSTILVKKTELEMYMNKIKGTLPSYGASITGYTWDVSTYPAKDGYVYVFFTALQG